MTTVDQPTTQARGRSASGAEAGSDRARVDGPLKVTGTAPYAGDQPVDHPAFLFPVTSTVTRGRIATLDTRAAEQIAGVQLVLSHHNAPRLRVTPLAELKLLQDDVIRVRHQIVAVVVADTLAAARHAAGLVRVTYDEEPAQTTFDPDDAAVHDVKRFMGQSMEATHGDVEGDLARSAHRVDATYTTSANHHSPIEPHAVTATWLRAGGLDPRGVRLHLFDASQTPVASLGVLSAMLGLLPHQIRVESPYIGGSFGGKVVPGPLHVVASLAAKVLAGRPVKAVLTRQLMFHATGYRPPTSQRVRLGLDGDGRFTALDHVATVPASRVRSYFDFNTNVSKMMYAASSRHTQTRALDLDVPPGVFMRAPGEMTGTFALETAIDELAHASGIDPIEVRVRNEPEVDPESGKPWSVREVVRCLREGAERFGWSERTVPGQRRDGEWQLGLGVACAAFPNVPMPPGWARIRYSDGRFGVELQATDIGTGAYTVLAQIAADELGVSADRIDVTIGGTNLAFGLTPGGSMGTYTWGASVVAAARAFRDKHGDDPAEGATCRARGSLAKGTLGRVRSSFGAQFAEVAVSRVTGETRVRRLYALFDAGRIINPRTARSQLIGGMTMGLSAALHEESYRDGRFGHVVNSDLAGYHVAAHADVIDVQAEWLDGFDPYAGPTGAKGIGEVGIVGVAPAIGNAIFNATGRRLRDMPFTPDKLFDATSEPDLGRAPA